MAAGRSDVAETFSGHIACVFTYTIVSEDDDQFFIIRTGNNAPCHGANSHKEIRNNYAYVRIHDGTQMNKNPAFPQAHGMQGGLEIFQKFKPEISLFYFTRQMNIRVPK
jgi:hypothetical protein